MARVTTNTKNKEQDNAVATTTQLINTRTQLTEVVTPAVVYAQVLVALSLFFRGDQAWDT
jgi:hypothetical protein